ncbi:hypothetical protein EBT31_07250 [bacterium]|jgi:hypothetical protein|nr:hypothetical protein [bacterium]NBX49081.1 hypothetical protein [bacterium]
MCYQFPVFISFMTIAEALKTLQEERAIIVRDKTFEPQRLDEVVLESGETVFWVHAKDGTWLSLDAEGEEVIQFEDIVEELEPEDDIVVYGGQDYEFSYESKITLLTDDGGTMMMMREFEGPSAIIRLIEDESTGDTTASYGRKVNEEELQEA